MLLLGFRHVGEMLREVAKLFEPRLISLDHFDRGDGAASVADLPQNLADLKGVTFINELAVEIETMPIIPIDDDDRERDVSELTPVRS